MNECAPTYQVLTPAQQRHCIAYQEAVEAEQVALAALVAARNEVGVCHEAARRAKVAGQTLRDIQVAVEADLL